MASKVQTVFLENEGDELSGTVMWAGTVVNNFEKEVPRVLIKNDEATFGLTASHVELAKIVKELTVGEVVTLTRGAKVTTKGEGDKDDYSTIQYSRS